MTKFIGLLSNQDAVVLERYAAKSRAILEFGSGGSTHIFAQAAPPQAKIVSVDTDPAWIDRTKDVLTRLGRPGAVAFQTYAEWEKLTCKAGEFSLVFVDGATELRLPFARKAWGCLAIGGHMIFHDTRNKKYRANALTLIAQFADEIDLILLNENSSNTSAIRKKRRERLVDWTKTEGKPPWAYGRAPVPPEFWK